MPKSSLTRKKVTVRSRRGKAFQRSVMVRAQALGQRAVARDLHAEIGTGNRTMSTGGRIMAGIKTMFGRGGHPGLAAMNPWESHHGTNSRGEPISANPRHPGPSSDHSLIAMALGEMRRYPATSPNRHMSADMNHAAAVHALTLAEDGRNPHTTQHRIANLYTAFRESVTHIPHNPNKWVR